MSQLKLTRRKGTPTWYARGTIDGHRYYESTGTTSREHAQAWIRKREREILDRVYHGDRAATFADAILIYIEKGGEKRFLKPLLDAWGDLRLSQITATEVSRLARDHYGHMKPASVKRQLYTPLNAVMHAAHRAHLGPLQRFDAPRVKRDPVTYADDRWLETFFKAAPFRIAACVLFLTLTGSRVSEACRLACADVDLERGEAVLRRTKSGKSRRLALAPVLVDALRTCIENAPDDRVFGYSSRWSVNQAIERVCKRAGIAYLSSHKVGRHAFAARLLAQGRSLKLVQDAGGWASIQVVAATYGHLEQSAIDDAVRGAGETLPALPKPKDAGA